jgi:ABC-2 type transport system permease protein
MKNVNYILSVFWKEIQLMLKDGGALAMFFLFPLLLSSLMGGINVMTNQEDTAAILLHVGLVNADTGPFGSEVAKALSEIAELEVTTFDTADAAEERVAKGEATAAIFIPAGFSSDIGDHIPTAIDVVVDPGQPESASIVTGIMNQVVAEVTIWGEVQYGVRSLLEGSGILQGLTRVEQEAVGAQTLGVIMTTLNEMRRTPVIAVESENLGGVESAGSWLPTFFAYLFPGFTVMFIFINASWSSGSLLDERESGTLRRLLAAPIPRGTVIIGKMLAFVLLSCMQVVVMFTSASIFFDMALGESPLALVVVTLVIALTSTALGMLIAALAKSSNKAANAGIIVGIVMSAVGGAIGARAPMTRAGGFAGILASLTPQGHAVNAYYSVMAENATLVQVLPEIGILLVMCVAFYVIAVWRFKFEV